MQDLSYFKLYKKGNIVTLSIDSGSAFNNINGINTIFTLPEKYRPIQMLNISALNLTNNNHSVFLLYENGNFTFKFSEHSQGAYYFTVSYITKN